jgi:hypothetical protein
VKSPRHTLLLMLLIVARVSSFASEPFRVATYNVENLIETATSSRPAKSVEARKKICECILAMRPDVLALQEVGDTNALLSLRGMLRDSGLFGTAGWTCRNGNS